MITKQYFVLIFIFNLFVFQFKEAFTQDELLYTCEYKSTKYVDHKIYGNDSHFLNEYTKTLGWIKITNTDVKLSGIGWSQGMKFSSVSIDNKFIKTTDPKGSNETKGLAIQLIRYWRINICHSSRFFC